MTDHLAARVAADRRHTSRREAVARRRLACARRALAASVAVNILTLAALAACI